MEKLPEIILGIDPGTNILGFGVIRIDNSRPSYVDMGVIDLRKEKDAYTKLERIYSQVSDLCRSFSPAALAVESPFFGKNAQVILKLGRAQGAAIIAAAHQGIPVYEYAPRLAKQAITGNGAASKEQVEAMLRHTLGIDLETPFLDATDALAIALCHYYQMSNPLASASSGKGSWEQFIKNNPGRVK